MYLFTNTLYSMVKLFLVIFVYSYKKIDRSAGAKAHLHVFCTSTVDVETTQNMASPLGTHC
jgi:hypothetical protein